MDSDGDEIEQDFDENDPFKEPATNINNDPNLHEVAESANQKQGKNPVEAIANVGKFVNSGK